MVGLVNAFVCTRLCADCGYTYCMCVIQHYLLLIHVACRLWMRFVVFIFLSLALAAPRLRLRFVHSFTCTSSYIRNDSLLLSFARSSLPLFLIWSWLLFQFGRWKHRQVLYLEFTQSKKKEKNQNSNVDATRHHTAHWCDTHSLPTHACTTQSRNIYSNLRFHLPKLNYYFFIFSIHLWYELASSFFGCFVYSADCASSTNKLIDKNFVVLILFYVCGAHRLFFSHSMCFVCLSFSSAQTNSNDVRCKTNVTWETATLAAAVLEYSLPALIHSLFLSLTYTQACARAHTHTIR